LGPPWVTSPATANKPSPALRVAPWPMALSFQNQMIDPNVIFSFQV
jgi:hypothetical protein